MNCPKCRAEVDFARPDCVRCGVDLLQALEERAWTEKPEEPSTGPSRRLPRSDRALAILALGLVAVAGAWAVVASRGPAATPGAWAAIDHGFSFLPPSGWSVDERLPDDGGWTEAMRLVRPPAVIVVLVGGARPSTPQSARMAAEDRFDGVSTRLEEPSPTQVAGKEAWSVRVSGDRALLPSPNRGKSESPLGQAAPAYESMDFEAESVLVPGARRSFLIQFYSERADFERRRAHFLRFLEGFSVL
ncbi:MAG: hypothetical protein HY553_23280 [Elusimicrobia bacterium]|nr:hypothetical protein [Elusimicrobiota bacterium]